MTRDRHSRRRAGEAGSALTHELLVFRLGGQLFVAARESVRAIRPSPRLRSALGPMVPSGVPLISLSAVLGFDRDSSVDRRVIEVLHWGTRIGLEVTAIDGIRHVPRGSFRALPPAVRLCLSSHHVLGVARLEEGLAIALDLPGLLVERGVEITTER